MDKLKAFKISFGKVPDRDKEKDKRPSPTVKDQEKKAVDKEPKKTVFSFLRKGATAPKEQKLPDKGEETASAPDPDKAPGLNELPDTLCY